MRRNSRAEAKLAFFFVLLLVITILPFNYQRASADSTITDSYNDSSKISSSNQIDVSGGQVQLDTYAISLGLEGYGSCRKITVDSGDVDADLTDFPVLVHLNSSNIDWSKVQDDLDDLRFTQDNSTLLMAELDNYIVNSEAWIWVKIPSVSNISDTILFMYYNNATISSYWNSESVWDSNFVLVSHMNDDPDTSHIRDSTSNDNDGTKVGVNEPIETALGKIGDTQNYDGIDDYIAIPVDDSFKPTDAITLSAWFNPDVYPQISYPFLFSIDRGGWRGYNLHLRSDTGAVGFEIMALGGYVATAKTDYDTGTWYHIAATYNGVTQKIYVNGIEDGTRNVGGAITYWNEELRLGWNSIDGGYFDGREDEARISIVARSPAWILASYESERNHLLTYGIEKNSGIVYYSNGNFQSVNLLTGLNVTEISSFYYNCSIAGSETIKFQFSQNLVQWYNSTQISSWNIAADGSHTINLKTLGWKGGFFYYRCNMTSVTTPLLYSITLNYSTTTTLGFMMTVFLVLMFIAVPILIIVLARRR